MNGSLSPFLYEHMLLECSLSILMYVSILIWWGKWDVSQILSQTSSCKLTINIHVTIIDASNEVIKYIPGAHDNYVCIYSQISPNILWYEETFASLVIRLEETFGSTIHIQNQNENQLFFSSHHNIFKMAQKKRHVTFLFLIEIFNISFIWYSYFNMISI